MPLGLCFWFLMIVWLVFNGTWYWSQPAAGGYWGPGASILIFVLFGILGWHAFGPPIHG